MLASSCFAQTNVYDAVKRKNLPDVVVFPGSTVLEPTSEYYRGGNQYEVSGAGVNLVSFFKKIDSYNSGNDIQGCKQILYWQQRYICLLNNNVTRTLKLVSNGNKYSFRKLEDWPLSMEGMPYHGAYQGIPLRCHEYQVSVFKLIRPTVKIECMGQRGNEKYHVMIALIYRMWWWENDRWEIKIDLFPKLQIIPGSIMEYQGRVHCSMQRQPSWILDRFMNHKMDGSLKRFFKLYEGFHDMNPVLNFEWHNGRDIHLDDISWVPKSFWLSNMNWIRDNDQSTVAITTMSGYKLNAMNPEKGGALLFYKFTHSGHWGLNQDKQAEWEIELDNDLTGSLRRSWVELTTGEYAEDFFATLVTRQYYKRWYMDKKTFKTVAVPTGRESWYAAKTFESCGPENSYSRPVLRRENFDIFAYHTYENPDVFVDYLVVNLEANTAECIKNVNGIWHTPRDEKAGHFLLLIGKQDNTVETWELVGDKSIAISGDSASNGEVSVSAKGKFGKDAPISDKFKVRKVSKAVGEGIIALGTNKVDANGSWTKLPISSANAFGNGVQFGASGVDAAKIKIDHESSSQATISINGYEGNIDNFHPLGKNRYLAWTEYVKENNQFSHKWWLLNCPFVENGATSCSVVKSGQWGAKEEFLEKIQVFGNTFFCQFTSMNREAYTIKAFKIDSGEQDYSVNGLPQINGENLLMFKIQKQSETTARLYTATLKYKDRYNFDGLTQTYTLTSNGGNISVQKDNEVTLPFYFDWYDMKWLENVSTYDREEVEVEESGFKYKDIYIKYEQPLWRFGSNKIKRMRHALSADGKWELRYERLLHNDAMYSSCFLGDKLYTVSNTR